MGTPARADPDRVRQVHRQVRRTLGLAAAFTLATPVLAAAPTSMGTWAALHLFLVGGLLLAISGASQLLAVTWSSSPAPPHAVAALQRWVLAVGAVAVVAGREVGSRGTTVAGGLLVAASLALLAALLVRIRAGASTPRFAPAIDAYLLAVAAGALGALLGVEMVSGRAGTSWFELRGAHLTLNLHGLVGLVIAGTLPYFVATQARMKMSPRATPVRLRAVAGSLAAATVVSAAGHLAGRPGLAAAGLAAYAGVLLALATLLPVPGRRQLRWAGPRLVQLGAGLAWWFGATIWLAIAALDGGPAPSEVLAALVVGGYAQVLVASLAYFGPVLRGGGHEQLSAGFATTRSWIGLVAANVAAAALATGTGPLAAIALATWALDSAVRAVTLVTDRAAPDR